MQATLSFKVYTKDDFPEFNCYDVVDLTWQTSEMVKKQLAAEKSGKWGELQAWKDNSMLVDIPSFRRILSLRINSPSSSDVLESRNGAEKSSAEIRSNKESVLNAVNSLEGRNDIIYVGPNFTHESQRVPNDPQYTGGNQWAIDHIGLPDAWDITTGSADVRVGVIDTGIHGNHQDLVNRLNNNLHRDFRNATTVNVPTPFDTDEHGTHVAGIIGAETNVTPARGMAGAAWNSSLVCLIISENGSWFVDNAILAVDHATANNIQILNYSGRVRNRNNVVNINDPVFEQAIRAYPGLFVTAAGNTGTTGNNNDTNPQFPANYARTLNNVISVGATNNADQRANFSHYGVNTVSIYAPGVNIRSSIPGTATYASWDGTSMASPYVAGVAALIRSILTNITAAQLREFILNNADPITINTPIGNQNVHRLNAGEAVKNAAFVTSNGGNTITVRQGAVLRDVIIPSQINGITITTIGNSAFTNQTQLSQISIPASVKSISLSAFSNYIHIVLANGWTQIPAGFFQNQGRLSQITIPAGVTSIGDSAFRNCGSLQSVYFAHGSTLVNIGERAFENSIGNSTSMSRKNITIPASVETIGSNAFATCDKLTVTMQGTVPPVQNGSFIDVNDIIVLASAVQSYGASWTDVAFKIHSGSSIIFNITYSGHHLLDFPLQEFLCYSTIGGEFLVEAFMRTGGFVNISMFDTTNYEIILDIFLEPHIVEIIYLEPNVMYHIQLSAGSIFGELVFHIEPVE